VPTLDDEILEETGLEKEELAKLAGQIDQMKWPGNTWTRGAAVPGNEDMTIHSIFGSAREEKRVPHVAYVLGDLRVYATSVKGTIDRTSFAPADFVRLTVNRASPAVTREKLARETFVTEVARELLELQDMEDEAMGEVCSSAECATELRPGARYCDECGLPVADADEPEPALPANGSTIPATPPVAGE